MSGLYMTSVIEQQTDVSHRELAPIYIYIYIYSHSHSHNHLSCCLLELPGISRGQVVPASLDLAGPRAA